MSYPADPRVLFAAERTLLAWQRSAIALMGFGFVVERFGLFLQCKRTRRHPVDSAASPLGGSGYWTRAGVALNLIIALIALALATHFLWPVT